MDILNIIYYSKQDEKRKTLSLRDLCLRDEYNKGLETIFYVVRDAVDTNDLLDVFSKICYETFQLEEETTSYILFSVIDVYGNTNYLKFQRCKVFKKENTNEDN